MLWGSSFCFYFLFLLHQHKEHNQFLSFDSYEPKTVQVVLKNLKSEL